MKGRTLRSIVCLSLMISLLVSSLSGCGQAVAESAAPEAEAQTAQESVAPEAEAQTAQESAAPETAAEEENASEDEVIYYPDPGIRENLPDQAPSEKEDYYLSFVYDDLKAMELPAGVSTYSHFDRMGEQVEETVKELLAGDRFTSKDQETAAELYRSYLDIEKRNEDGFKFVKPYVDKIEKVASLDACYDLLMSEFPVQYNSPTFGLFGMPDYKNSSMNILFMTTANLSLDDSAEYTTLTELGELYKKANDEFYLKLLEKYGYSKEQAQKLIDDRYDLECQMAEFIDPVEVMYRDDYYQYIYNPYTKEELLALAGDFPMERFLKYFGADQLEKYVLQDPNYIKNLSAFWKEDNLEGLKAYLIIELLSDTSTEMDEETYKLHSDWENAKSGSTGIREIDSYAFESVSKLMPEALSDLYVSNCFTPEDRKTAEEVVFGVKDAMRKRLENVDWMSDDTRAYALEKLDALAVHVGYADSFLYDYSDIDLSKKSDLFSKRMMVDESQYRQGIALAGTAVNRDAWNCSIGAYVVNAMCRQDTNDINIPAAILQEPLFSSSASVAENLGGIGCIVGHEITHAFDTAGAQYDKDGNLSDWWTEEDWTRFDELTKAVRQRYHAYATVGEERVNGDFTVGESVADLGGTAAALDALKDATEPGADVNYRDFFRTYAKTWARIQTRENALYRLKNDPHPPMCLRANVNSAQFDEFYEAFDIVEGDPMYTAPENRLKVW